MKLQLPTGSVDAALRLPENADFMLVLAHGAGAGYEHAHMSALAEAFAQAGIGTFRFNFPYMQAGKRRVDGKAIAMDSIRCATEFARAECGVPLALGGHSFGARMASHLAATGEVDALALVYCSFPLHPAKKPDTSRAAHLACIAVPQLFLSGSRDDLADASLLQKVVDDVAGAEICWLAGADHSFKVRKRDLVEGAPTVYEQAAQAAFSFLSQSLPAQP